MTEPVGPQYGLEPRKARNDALPPISSHSLVSETHYSAGSEFGGVDGIIQPAPHVPTASERLSMTYAIDPMDDGTRPDSVLPPEYDGAFDPR
jgi:hypothetical protein